MLGSLIRYLKGMRIMMFQLSGFYFTTVLKPVPPNYRIRAYARLGLQRRPKFPALLFFDLPSESF